MENKIKTLMPCTSTEGAADKDLFPFLSRTQQRHTQVPRWAGRRREEARDLLPISGACTPALQASPPLHQPLKHGSESPCPAGPPRPFYFLPLLCENRWSSLEKILSQEGHTCVLGGACPPEDCSWRRLPATLLASSVRPVMSLLSLW